MQEETKGKESNEDSLKFTEEEKFFLNMIDDDEDYDLEDDLIVKDDQVEGLICNNEIITTIKRALYQNKLLLVRLE